MQIISIIAAIDKNNGIGYKGRLPWSLPADLANFKKITLGRPIIMGQNTWVSLGRPLPGRRNIVVTQDKNFQSEGCEIVNSIPDALAIAGEGEVFVIGGGQIYKSTIDIADRLYITKIQGEFTVDTFFPEIDSSRWSLVSNTPGIIDEKNAHPHDFLVFSRPVTPA